MATAAATMITSVAYAAANMFSPLA
jgi:hypothetical protein